MKKFIALVLSLVMALSLCVPAWGADASPTDLSGSGTESDPYLVDTADELAAAIDAGGYIKMTANITMAENTRIVVGSGKTVTLDLGGNTLSSTNTKTEIHNFFIDVKGGALTISNGAVEYMHTGTNMVWNGATEVFDVTAGGVLNMSGVDITVSGTDMTFCVHLNNWGTATLNADDCEFTANYCAIRAFNSGWDMNNVTIKNSKLTGGYRVFWVQYYTADVGDGPEGTVEQIANRLNIDIFNNNNTFVQTVTTRADHPTPIRYGNTTATATFLTESGSLHGAVAKVGSVEYKDLQKAVAAAKDGDTITLLDDVTLSAPITIPAGVTLTGDKTISVAADATLGTDSSIVELFGTIDGVKFAVPDLGTFNAVRMNSGAALKNSTFTGAYDGVTGNVTRGFVTVTGATDITISGNTFTNVRQPGYINDNTAATISKNTVDGTRGFCVAGADDVIFTGNTFENTADWDKIVCDICYFASTKQLTDAEYYAISKDNNNCRVEKQNENASNVTYQWAGVASVGDVNYDTLQEAVAAVADGGTITVLMDGEYAATVEKAISFTVKNDVGATVTIKEADGYNLTVNGNKYTVEKLYTITFKANGGSGEMAADKVVAGKYTPPTECKFTNSADKTFKGWATTPDGVVITSLDVTNDVNLYAIWSVTVPVPDEENKETPVKVEATVSGSTAIIDKVEDLDKITDDKVKTESVTLDFSEVKGTTENTETSVNTVVIPSAVVEDIVEVVTSENKVDNLEIVTANATVSFDAEAVETISDNAADNASVSLTVDVEQVSTATDVTDANKEAFEEVMEKDGSENAVLLSIELVDEHGNELFSEGKSAGTATVKVKLADGLKSATLYYLDGSDAVKLGSYNADADGYITVTLKHFSEYVLLGSTDKVYSGGGYYVGGTNSTTDKTVTSASTFDAGIGLYIGMSVLSAMGGAVVLKKRK